MYAATTQDGVEVKIVDKGYVGDTLVLRDEQGQTWTPAQYGEHIEPLEMAAEAPAEPAEPTETEEVEEEPADEEPAEEPAEQ